MVAQETRIVLLLVFGLIFLCSIPVFAGNLLANGGFEEGTPRPGTWNILPGWSVRSFADVINCHSIDTQVAHSGRRSARITIDADKIGYFTPEPALEVKFDTLYRVNVWIKASEVTKEAGIECVLLDENKKFLGMSFVKKLMFSGTSEWREYTIEYKTPSEEALSPKPQRLFLVIYLKLSGSGTVWFDDASVEEAEAKSQFSLIVDFYPSTVAEKGTFYPIKGELSHLILYLFSDEWHPDYTISLMTPPGLELVSAYSFEGSNYPVLKRGLGDPGSTGTDERLPGYSRYEIFLPSNAVKARDELGGDLWYGQALIFAASDSATEGTLKWELSSDGDTLANGKIDVSPLPALARVRMPREFKVYSWYQPLLSNCPDNKVFQGLVELWDRVGIKGGETGLALPPRGDVLNARGWESFECFWGAYMMPSADCLTECLEGNALERKLQTFIGGDTDWVLCNYEPEAVYFNHFCGKCKTAFCKANGIPEASCPDTLEGILSLYPREYAVFRSRQHAELIRRFGEAVRAKGPMAAVSSYRLPYPLTEESIEAYLRKGYVDIRGFDPVIDVHFPQFYMEDVSQYWDNVAHNRQNLKRPLIPVVTSSERHNLMDYPWALTDPYELRQTVLASAVLGCRGIMLFVGAHTLDGKQLVALQDACRIIAEFEDFFLEGEELEGIAGLGTGAPHDLRILTRRLGDKYLISIFNFSPTQEWTTLVRVSLPRGAIYRLIQVGAGPLSANEEKGIWNRSALEKGVEIGIKPQDAVFILLEPVDQ